MSMIDGSAIEQQNLHVGTKQPRKLELAVPPGTRKRSFFSDTILDAGEGTRAKRAAHTAFAVAVQAGIVVALIVVPLFFVKGLDMYQLNRTLLVAPLPPSPPPPAVIRAQAAVIKQPVIQAQLSVPTIIPKKIATNALPDAGAPALAEMSGGVPGGMGDVLGGGLTGTTPPPAAAPARPKGPIRITGSMQEPRLLYSPPPVYPPFAAQAHISGSVYVEAVIDEQGNVTQVHAISGPPLLVGAALRAVSQRRYAPTILDGEAVAIVLKVEVAFRLG